MKGESSQHWRKSIYRRVKDLLRTQGQQYEATSGLGQLDDGELVAMRDRISGGPLSIG
jgi:hypothetical protein